MLFKKFQLIVQVVGCLTIGLLAVWGLLSLLGGASPTWAAIGQAAPLLAPQDIPVTLNYQGFLRNPDGSLTTGAYTITARFYDQATGVATPLYETTVPNVTVRDGLFNIVLGDDPALDPGVFDDVPRYIGISLNNAPELIPRQRLHAVPWAYTAKTLVANATVNGIASTGDIVVQSGQLDVNGDADVNGQLDVNGSVGIQTTAVPTIPLLVGQETGGTKLVVNDIPEARWGFDTHNYTLSFRNDKCQDGSCDFADPTTWPARLQLSNNGDISWGGHLKSMEIRGPWEIATWNGVGHNQTIMDPADSNCICFLTGMFVRDLDGDDKTSVCEVLVEQGNWILRSGAWGTDADAQCWARCLRW